MTAFLSVEATYTLQAYEPNDFLKELQEVNTQQDIHILALDDDKYFVLSVFFLEYI